MKFTERQLNRYWDLLELWALDNNAHIEHIDDHSFVKDDNSGETIHVPDEVVFAIETRAKRTS